MTAGETARAPATRRFFLSPAEIPGLLFGVLRGEPVALRRIVGARGAGRFGVTGALLGALAAVPTTWLPHLIGLHVALSIGVWLVARARSSIEWAQVERITLWMLTPVLLVAGIGRALGADLGFAWISLGGVHVLALRHLWRERPFGPCADDPVL